MIQIERIRMSLPAGFQHRATSIGLLIGKLLSEQHISEDVFIETISITQHRMPLNTTDEEFAEKIVHQIISQYRGRTK